MYTSHTILDFNLICILKFVFKHTLTSFKFLFFILKTNFINLIELVLIKTRFNICMCSLMRTYFNILLQEDFINCIVNNNIILFLPVKFISVYGIVPTVLGRPTLAYLKPRLLMPFLKFLSSHPKRNRNYRNYGN